MATLLKSSFNFSGFDETIVSSKLKGVSGLCPKIGSLQFGSPKSRYLGIPLVLGDQKGSGDWAAKPPNRFCVLAQTSICVSRAMRWWEKSLKPNMIEIHSAQELIDSLINAGDRLAIVDFYSPGCGGCKALHPKICQFAESNPNAIFLKVNYEELKTMCHTLHIHVLPFFRFYRGSEGRLCSFSCTNATIKKFKDAMNKHGTERCNIGGPTKGLDESEVLSLALIREVSVNLPFKEQHKMGALVKEENANAALMVA